MTPLYCAYAVVPITCTLKKFEKTPHQLSPVGCSSSSVIMFWCVTRKLFCHFAIHFIFCSAEGQRCHGKFELSHRSSGWTQTKKLVLECFAYINSYERHKLARDTNVSKRWVWNRTCFAVSDVKLMMERKNTCLQQVTWKISSFDCAAGRLTIGT